MIDRTFEHWTASAESEHDSAPPRRIPLLSIEEVLAASDPEWLIDDVLPLNGLIGLVAPSDHYKTFLALDMACCIASRDRHWCGRATRRGVAVYVAAEGSVMGIRQRVRAWCKHHDVEGVTLRDTLFVVPAAVDLLQSGAAAQLAGRIRERCERLDFLVIDTLARCTSRGNENDAKDMGTFIASCDELRGAFGTSLMAVHHTGRTGGNPRGSSAFDAALDTQIVVARAGDDIELRCEKQKDAERFKPLRLRPQSVGLGTSSSGKPLSSCVLVPVRERTTACASGTVVNAKDLVVLRAISDLASSTECTMALLIERLGGRRSTVYDAVKRLKAKGFVDVSTRGKTQLLRVSKLAERRSKSEVRDRPSSSERTSGSGRPKSGRSSAPKGRGTAGRTDRSDEAADGQRTQERGAA